MNEESKWLKIKEMTIELGIYLLTKASLDENVVNISASIGETDPNYAMARLEAHKKIFDRLVEDGYVNCIPIEGIDGYMARFSKKPDDFEEMMALAMMPGKGEEQNDEARV